MVRYAPALLCDATIQQLLPHLDALSIEKVEQSDAGLRLWANVRARTATCLSCGTAPGRVHGRHCRELADVPIAGVAAKICLQVRRFICGNAACTVRTFVEQVDGVTRRRLRSTDRVRKSLTSIGLAARTWPKLSSHSRCGR
jgi:transposase